MTTRRAEILLFMVTLVAAAGWLFSKLALQEFSAHTFLALRFLLASCVLTLFCWRQLLLLSRSQLIRSLVTGAALGAGMAVWVVALKRTEHIGEGAFIVSLVVVVVPIIGRLFFGDRVTLGLVFSLIPAVFGLALLSLEQGFVLNDSQWLFVLATLCFATHLNLSNHFVKKIPPMPLTSIQLFAVGLIALSTAAVRDDFFSVEWIYTLSASAWGWLLCSSLIATSLRFTLQTGALQKVSASHASMIFLVEPVWTALLSALFLSERMTVFQLTGCALIFTAVVFYRLKSPLSH